MSKTETQSEAPISKLRKAFELELIDNHLCTPPDLAKKNDCYADEQIQFAWEMAIFSWGFAYGTVEVERRRLDAENKALRARLDAPAAPLVDEREAFEEWARSQPMILDLTPRGDGYAGAFAQTMWMGWKARGAAVPSAGWISVDVALPPKNTEVAIWFAESTIPSTGQYTGLRADPNGWSCPSENYLSPGEHPNYPEGGYPTVTHWMELHAPGAAQAKKGGE